jgi:hypothetical protein
MRKKVRKLTLMGILPIPRREEEPVLYYKGNFERAFLAGAVLSMRASDNSSCLYVL